MGRTASYDFAFLQESSEHSSLSDPSRAKTYPTYVVRQTTHNVQSITSTGCTIPDYSVVSNLKRTFIHKDLHADIRRHYGDLPVSIAEVRFKKNETWPIIEYKKARDLDGLGLDKLDEPSYQRLIHSESYYWQPLGPSKVVLVLTDDLGQRVALFVLSDQEAQRNLSFPGSARLLGEVLGSIHILDRAVIEQEVVERILCTAIGIFEAMKRRTSPYGFPSLWSHLD